MQLKFRCDHCSQKLEADSTVSSTEVQCPACDQFIVVPEIRIQPGVVIGDFVIEKPLGSGGMGDVFLARQQTMDRMVALKILPEAMSRKKDKCERFLQEIKLTASLEHPNIVTAHAAGEDNGYYYMAMTYIDGENLEDMADRMGVLPEGFCYDMAYKLADALEYAWQQKQILQEFQSTKTS